MIHNAPNINHLWTRLLIEELRRNGVDTFYISPGSRSTPLTMAAAQTEGVQTHVHFDERGAAFAALGHAMGSERPTALICTSGTAAANYLPAIVEASQSGIPLIILTADRPPELTDTGANQAINQIGLYKNFVRWEHALPCPTTEMPAQALLTAIDQACHRANGNDPGPVHINCPFREPLAPTKTGDDWTEYLVPVERWLGSDEPYTRYAKPVFAVNEETACELEGIVERTHKGLLVVGRLMHRDDRASAIEIAQKLQWPVYCDITSGIQSSVEGCDVIRHHDVLLASEVYGDFCRPDTVLHLGGDFTSKRLLLHLQNQRPNHYVRIAAHPRRTDPGHITSVRLQAELREIAGLLNRQTILTISDWVDRHKAYAERAAKILESALENPVATITEPGALLMATYVARDGRALFLGNSMPVRDADMFARTGKLQGGVFANRGASGIDGNLATAIGLSRGLATPVVAVVGDITLLHDLSSLHMLRNADPPVTVVVINNDGGGIFSFLPIANEESVFEEFFGTPHGVDLQHAAALFDIEYHSPSSNQDLATACFEAMQSAKSAIIEIQTNRVENHRLHQDILEAVRKPIDEDE